MLRFFLHAVPLIVALLALFSVTIGFFDAGPAGALSLLDPARVPLDLLIGTWLLEASGLVALFLLIEGRMGLPWLDGLMAAWVAWIFRGPLLVVTVVVAAGKPQTPWFRLALAWWVLYSLCGLALALLSRLRRTRTAEPQSASEPAPAADEEAPDEPEPEPAAVEEA